MLNSQIEFIDSIAKACKVNSEYQILPSLTIAQAIKESNWGKSSLSRLYHNYFGMKWTSTCGCDYIELPTKEWNGFTYINCKARFRRYCSMAEGIKGYYKFIHSYKRYRNLIGEKNSQKACLLIQQDGWATSPTYGVSLYNDYVLKYNLLQYDGVFTPIFFVVGDVYVLTVNLYVRQNPKGEAVKFECLTENGKANAKFDECGNGILLKGTRVTCKDVITIDNQVWIKIPSGWICAIDGDKDYVI